MDDYFNIMFYEKASQQNEVVDVTFNCTEPLPNGGEGSTEGRQPELPIKHDGSMSAIDQLPDNPLAVYAQPARNKYVHVPSHHPGLLIASRPSRASRDPARSRAASIRSRVRKASLALRVSSKLCLPGSSGPFRCPDLL